MSRPKSYWTPKAYVLKGFIHDGRAVAAPGHRRWTLCASESVYADCDNCLAASKKRPAPDDD